MHDHGKILRSEFESLHDGMQRLAKVWHWKIIDEGEPTITLAKLGLAPPEPPASDTIEPLPPTLEEWVAAGYPADRYEAFMNPTTVE